ncbi:hypothetical protein, partial [Frankia sp. Cr1]|uniref:hypothetical protein n=1 Tax=Frankia sp. Cr1 TaxID=3073931 RepID=UPI002AD282DA
MDAETRRKRLALNLGRIDEPDQDFIRDINEGRAELQAERDALQRQLTALEDEAEHASNPALLEHLPIGPVDIAALPDKLSRRLFEVLRLEIRYDRVANKAKCRITLSGSTMKAAGLATTEIIAMAPLSDVHVRQEEQEETAMRTDHTSTPARFC